MDEHESRKQFEYEAGKALGLPTSIIELARKGDGYDHSFDSMNIMQPLNGWWHWWCLSRKSIVVEPTHFILKNDVCGDWFNEDLKCYTSKLDALKAKYDFGGEIIPVIDLHSVGLSIKRD